MQELENVVKIEDAEVRYDKKVVLRNINMDIKRGEIVGLLGPSGSGKTTIVKSIIGMKELSKGFIEVLGEKMPSLGVTSRIGYMAQSDALYDDLSAIDNILFFGELYNIKKSIIRKRAKDVLKLVNLEEQYKYPVKNFSGGMKRRLSLAIALVHRPRLLILDEPTVGIDPVLRKKFWDEFYKIKRDKGTIIITTHVMDEAYKCDRLFLIRNGIVIAEGSPDKVIKSSGGKTIEDAFLYFSSLKEEV
ncbi:ABC transporter ATP-binding protein [Clostridium sp. 001]|uniref:ABC transporter ATP-binding protein n=1 Tax=Clostridium sp. 001 TaxID=1970093 RepID=UPI001C2C3C5C|nr:ABC transporter ATP-binding protein [Clostridium sp. 001]QXE18385.1 ABC transporter ATP-binding protein [Clostridium sp. 001]